MRFLDQPSFNFVTWVAQKSYIPDHTENYEKEKEQAGLKNMTEQKIPELTHSILNQFKQVKQKSSHAKVAESNRRKVSQFLGHLGGWINQIKWAKHCSRYNLDNSITTDESMKRILNGLST